MNNTVACFKWVADDSTIAIRDDLQVDFSKVTEQISELDLCAIQAASTAAKSLQSKSYALTFGNSKVKSALKDALSRGMDEIYYISDDAQETVDGTATAKVLAKAIQDIPDVGLVFCAEGASDTFARQVGPRLAANLGWPVVTSVCGYEVKEDRVIADRKLDSVIETVEVSFPAVICVLSQAVTVPIPGLKAIMAAGRKPQHQLQLADIGISSEDLVRKTKIVEEQGYATDRKNVLFKEGESAERVSAFLDALIKEGVL